MHFYPLQFQGGILVAIGVCGFFLNIIELLFLRLFVKFSSTQNVFIVNVAVCDALMGVVATIRGLGIIDHFFVGAYPDHSLNEFCYAYAIMLNVITYVN